MRGTLMMIKNTQEDQGRNPGAEPPFSKGKQVFNEDFEKKKMIH